MLAFFFVFYVLIMISFVWILMTLLKERSEWSALRREMIFRLNMVASLLNDFAERTKNAKVRNPATGEEMDACYFDFYIFPEELTSLAWNLKDLTIKLRGPGSSTGRTVDS